MVCVSYATKTYKWIGSVEALIEGGDLMQQGLAAMVLTLLLTPTHELQRQNAEGHRIFWGAESFSENEDGVGGG